MKTVFGIFENDKLILRVHRDVVNKTAFWYYDGCDDVFMSMKDAVNHFEENVYDKENSREPARDTVEQEEQREQASDIG